MWQELPAQYFERSFDAVRHDMSQLSPGAHLSALDAAADMRIVALEVRVPLLPEILHQASPVMCKICPINKVPGKGPFGLSWSCCQAGSPE